MAFSDTIFGDAGITTDPNDPRTLAMRRAGMAPSGFDPNNTVAIPGTVPGPVPMFPGAPPAGGVTGTAGAAGSSPVSSDPPHPGVPPSSTLDQIMQTDRAALDEARTKMGALPNAPPRANLWSDPDHGKLRTLLTVFAGGVQGGITGDIRQGMHVMEPALQQPQEQANKTWQAGQTTAQRAYEDALQKFNVDLSSERATSESADRAAQQKERDANTRFRDFQMAGGPEQKKIELETADREARAKQLEASGAPPEQVARMRATGQMGDTTPKTDAELALAAHRTGPDGKPTQEALQAAQAFKDLQKQRLDQIHATKNPNEQAILLKDLQTNYVQMRGQLEREATAIENNIMSKNDPAAQASLKALRQSMAGIDEDLKYVNSEISARIKPVAKNAPNTPSGGGAIQQFQGSQNFTVSAPGKPAVQKSLTYQQVQQLQQAGVQLTQVKAAKPTK
jgi:hypothetical protein